MNMVLELTAEVTATSNEDLIKGLELIIERLKYGYTSAIAETAGARVNFDVQEV